MKCSYNIDTLPIMCNKVYSSKSTSAARKRCNMQQRNTPQIARTIATFTEWKRTGDLRDSLSDKHTIYTWKKKEKQSGGQASIATNLYTFTITQTLQGHEYHLVVLWRYLHAFCGLLKFRVRLLTVPVHGHSNIALQLKFQCELFLGTVSPQV